VARREAAVRTKHPRVGGFLLAVTDEPRSTKVWAKGAHGERLVGERLDALSNDGVIVFHDRRMPHSRANIDHIAIAPTGVYVIDAKNYSGRLERRDKGGWLTRDDRIYVNGRDQTHLVDKLAPQVDAVRRALRNEYDDIPIQPVLCFTGVDIGLLARPFSIRGTLITWPRSMQKAVDASGPIPAQLIRSIAHTISVHLHVA
jgi:hypothetical protein